MPLFLAPTTWMSEIHNNPGMSAAAAKIPRLAVHLNNMYFSIDYLLIYPLYTLSTFNNLFLLDMDSPMALIKIHGEIKSYRYGLSDEVG